MDFATRLRNRLAVLDGTHRAKLRLNAPVASFTFDDFPVSACDVGGAMLEEAGARGTFFANASFHEQTVDGIPHYRTEHLKKLLASGHELGCHSFHHVRLGTKGAAFARQSAEENSAFMKKLLGEQFLMTSFAYPFGDASPGVKRAMARRFSLCRGVRQRTITGDADLAQLSIVSLESRHWDEAVMRATIAEARASRSWLIFLTHDISESPTPYGSTPAMLRTTLGLLKESAVEILTLKAAAAKGIFG